MQIYCYGSYLENRYNSTVKQNNIKSKSQVLKCNKDLVSFCGNRTGIIGSVTLFIKKTLRKLHRDKIIEARIPTAEELGHFKQKAQSFSDKVLKPIPQKIAQSMKLQVNEVCSPEAADNALKIAYNLRNEGIENHCYLRASGEITSHAIGSNSEVTTFCVSGVNCINIHNHPNFISAKCPPSPEDVFAYVHNKTKLNIVSTPKGLYTMVATKELDKNDIITALKKILEFKKELEKLSSELNKKYKKKEISREEADNIVFECLDYYWKQNAEKLGFKYEYKSWS